MGKEHITFLFATKAFWQIMSDNGYSVVDTGVLQHNICPHPKEFRMTRVTDGVVVCSFCFKIID